MERFNGLKKEKPSENDDVADFTCKLPTDEDHGKDDSADFSCECETVVEESEDKFRLRHWNDLGMLMLI